MVSFFDVALTQVNDVGFALKWIKMGDSILTKYFMQDEFISSNCLLGFVTSFFLSFLSKLSYFTIVG